MVFEKDLQRTPLFAEHVSLGARMVPFAGFEMPVQYTGIVDEHLAVRRSGGIFDVSHMGELLVTGPGSAGLIQSLVTNDVARLYDGRAMYTVMCNVDGGIVDDLLVYRLAVDRYMMVVNAANIQKDLDWVRNWCGSNATVEDISDATALIALQGPSSIQILSRVAPGLRLADLKYYHFLMSEPGRFLGCTETLISRTGYTGEPGFEIYCEPDCASDIWRALLDAGRDYGLRPAGLGARDTLRLEAGLALYGNELDEATNPIEAGLEWLVRFDKGEFVGRDALERIRPTGPKRRLIGFMLEERGIPRHGYRITAGGRGVGVVTSGTQSPVLNQGIGMGYVENRAELVESGSSIAIDVRGHELAARTVRPPFHKK